MLLSIAQFSDLFISVLQIDWFFLFLKEDAKYFFC